MLLQAMAGHDPADPASANRPVADFSADLGKGARGLRIGVIRHFHETDNRASDATLAGIDAAIDFYRQEGATVRDVTLSSLADYNAPGYVIMLTEALTLHAPWLRSRFNDYGDMFGARMAVATLVSGADLTQAHRRRRQLCQEMAAAMADCDILLTAAAPGEAPRIDAIGNWTSMEKPGFTMPFNITGTPAISICTGFGAGGLPVAMQLVGKPFAEPTVFRAAHAYERAMAWRKRRPA